MARCAMLLSCRCSREKALEDHRWTDSKPHSSCFLRRSLVFTEPQQIFSLLQYSEASTDFFSSLQSSKASIVTQHLTMQKWLFLVWFSNTHDTSNKSLEVKLAEFNTTCFQQKLHKLDMNLTLWSVLRELLYLIDYHMLARPLTWTLTCICCLWNLPYVWHAEKQSYRKLSFSLVVAQPLQSPVCWMHKNAKQCENCLWTFKASFGDRIQAFIKTWASDAAKSTIQWAQKSHEVWWKSWKFQPDLSSTLFSICLWNQRYL